jgi:hypothetical protein
MVVILYHQSLYICRIFWSKKKREKRKRLIYWNEGSKGLAKILY